MRLCSRGQLLANMILEHFVLFCFSPKEAKRYVANVDVAVQPALLALLTKTKRHQILLSTVI